MIVQTVPDDWAIHQLRAVRRDSYRCQVKLPNGARCGARAGKAEQISRGNDFSLDNLQAVCQRHSLWLSTSPSGDLKAHRLARA